MFPACRYSELGLVESILFLGTEAAASVCHFWFPAGARAAVCVCVRVCVCVCGCVCVCVCVSVSVQTPELAVSWEPISIQTKNSLVQQTQEKILV